jgi:hypothetical protein
VVGETEEFSDQEPDLDSDSGLPGNILLIALIKKILIELY